MSPEGIRGRENAELEEKKRRPVSIQFASRVNRRQGQISPAQNCRLDVLAKSDDSRHCAGVSVRLDSIRGMKNVRLLRETSGEGWVDLLEPQTSAEEGEG